jgi:hypothetical protein
MSGHQPQPPKIIRIQHGIRVSPSRWDLFHVVDAEHFCCLLKYIPVGSKETEMNILITKN